MVAWAKRLKISEMFQWYSLYGKCIPMMLITVALAYSIDF